MVDYTIANQIRPFQAPDVAGIVGAMQGLELNRMRSQQLQGAEQERNALRQYLSDPNVDIMSPETSRRVLAIAPTIGGPALNAAVAARREGMQAQTAQAELLLKNIEIGRERLVPIRTLPEADRPAAYTAWLDDMERRIPGFRQGVPRTYSPEAYIDLISKANEIISANKPDYVVTQVPGSPPFLTDRRTGMTRPATEAETAGAPTAPVTPIAAPTGPRAGTRPGMTPGQTMAADFLRRREGFRESPYYDVNAYRGGYGSDTVTMPDGTVVPVRQGMTISREDAERDLARRIPEFTQRAAANIGQDRFDALPPNAQAALISIAYNYGRIPESIRAAARSGDLAALAQAVAGLAGDNQGVNAIRRREEAAMIAGTPVNVMSGRGATTNAMLAPPDAMAMNMPQLPTFAPPRTLAEADYQKRMMDMVADLEKKRIEAERRRSEQPERVQEAGQTTEAQERARIQAREAEAKRVEAEKLNTAISELERISRPGGLLERSTGSGVGRLLDVAGEFVGVSSRGAQAAAALAPIADVVLKMVPRFEGPQSDKDTAAYQAAAGRLADPTIPNETRLAAAREIIRLMRDRRDQFSYTAGGSTTPTAGPAPQRPAATAAPPAPPAPPGMSQSDWGRLWGVMKPEERALWQN